MQRGVGRDGPPTVLLLRRAGQHEQRLLGLQVLAEGQGLVGALLDNQQEETAGGGGSGTMIDAQYVMKMG